MSEKLLPFFECGCRFLKRGILEMRRLVAVSIGHVHFKRSTAKLVLCLVCPLAGVPSLHGFHLPEAKSFECVLQGTLAWISALIVTILNLNAIVVAQPAVNVALPVFR